MCHFVGPANHTVLACMSEDVSVRPDPACQFGLLHSTSRACCASYCNVCQEKMQQDIDHACSVSHIIRLAPLCSAAGPPCIVGHPFDVPLPEAIRTTNTSSLPSLLTSQTASVPSASFPPWLSELVLPLATGFLACSCSLALCCYCLREARSWHSVKAPTSPPSNARVLGKARPRPKEKRRRRRAGRMRPSDADEIDPEELPALVELEELRPPSSDVLQMEDETEPYPLVDLWASNAGGAEKKVLEEGGSQGASDAVPPELDPVAKQSKASLGKTRSAWHSKWENMEADLEAALAMASEGLATDIPRMPQSTGRRPRTKRGMKPNHKNTGRSIILEKIYYVFLSISII